MKFKIMSFHVLLLIFQSIIFSGCSKEDVQQQSVPYTEEAPQGYKVYEFAEQKVWLDTIAQNLGKPWGMDFLPNGDILFSERKGTLHRIGKDNGQVEEISGLPDIASVGQGGLLDILLHPDYESNGWLYLSYSVATGRTYTTEISRAKLDGNNLVELEKLFTAEPSYGTTHHFGCRLVLQNGYLFFGVGDRGYMDHAQKLDRHNGKIMRIHEDGAIPTDNPFVSTSNAKPEIWAYGIRNPQGLDLHPVTGDLWEHEHGPKGGDEVNIIQKGLNYGWPEITYGIDYDGSIISELTHKEGMEQPVTYWVPSIAPCGMAFNGGNKYPAWKNSILIGGLVSRSLYRVDLNGNDYAGEERMFEGIARVRNVEVSPDGFIYMATEDQGYIFRVVPTN